MKRITCEMCGSTDLIKKDGLFECQSCGTKYSVEEAKKMMVEGTVQVEGTVKVDNKDKIDNYLKMAESAYESDNFKESEEYANKIIEIDPKHPEAWFIKGKAAGWQSTIANVRFSESIECWSNALKNVKDDRHDSMRKEVEEETLKLAKALMITRANNFKSNPSTNNYEELCNFNTIVNPFVLLISKAGLIISLDDFLEFMADTLNSAAVGGFKTANEYYGTKKEDMNKYKYTNWLEYTDNCINVLKNAANKARTEATLNLIYKNLEYIQNTIINSKSYCFIATGYGSYYGVDTELNTTAKKLRRDEIAKYPEEKAKQLKEIEKAKREAREKYFEEHPEEKTELEKTISDSKKEIKNLHKEINDYNKDLETIEKNIAKEVKPLIEKMNKIGNELDALSNEKKSLGLFKSKEKKEIQEKIDSKEEEWSKISDKIINTRNKLREEHDKEISSLNKSIEKNKKEIDKLIEEIIKASTKRFGEANDTSELECETEEESFTCDRCGASFVDDLNECPECGAEFE